MKKTWRIIDIVNWGSEFFAGKGIESPRLNIELLMCDLMKFDRIDLYTHHEKPLTDEELALLKDAVLRRAKREPLQHITNKAYFMDLELFVNQDVLIPRPETELLVDLLLKENDPGSELKILDIGSGSGCISLGIAGKLKNSGITALDISGKALDISKSNAEKNNINNINFLEYDILSGCLEGQKYDIIVSNPPYIPHAEYLALEPEVLLHEPGFALTDNGDGLTFYRRFNEIFHELLNPGGKFYLEIGFGQGSDITKIFEESKYEIKIHKDFSLIERIISGRIKS